MTWKDFFAGLGITSILTIPLRVSPEKIAANILAWWRVFNP